MLCMRKKSEFGEEWPLQREEKPRKGRRDLRNGIGMGLRDGMTGKKFPQVTITDGLSHQ